MILASIPSPARGVWHLGPVPIRAYALCIIAGIIVAVMITRRRWVARGGHSDDVGNIALWAVPFGIIGGRLYHVVTSPELYFAAGRQPIRALYIWEGGLGIWGAIALGALGAWIGCQQHGVRLPAFADAAAPGLVLAQAIGRFGNYFNQELYGAPTTLPWALRIDAAHRPADTPDIGLYHPTFLYESLWCVGVAVLLIWVERRYRFGHGHLFALCIAAYTLGRVWVEALRVDHANHILGVRLNVWTSIIIFAVAVASMALGRRDQPGPAVDPDAGDQPAAAGSEADPEADPEAEPGVRSDVDSDVDSEANADADGIARAGGDSESSADAADAR